MRVCIVPLGRIYLMGVLLLLAVSACRWDGSQGMIVSPAPASTLTIEPDEVYAAPTATATRVAALPNITPTSTRRMPSPTATATQVLPGSPTVAHIAPKEQEERGDDVTITVIYDNNAYDPRLQTAWGFACLVESGPTAIMFDTGGDGTILLDNMATLDIKPQHIERVVLSHIHSDHTGGLSSLLDEGGRPIVYVPRSFPPDFKSQIQANVELVEIHEAAEISQGVYTTGEIGTGLVEQALVLKTSKGLVIVTGCAHPGVVQMVRQAKGIGKDEVYLVLGGFHLGNASRSRIAGIIEDFRRLGVQKVAPCHCTGDKAIGMFREAYGENFIPNGVGQVIQITP